MKADKRRARAQRKARQARREATFHPQLAEFAIPPDVPMKQIGPDHDIETCPQCGASGLSLLSAGEFREHVRMAGVSLRMPIESVPDVPWWWCHECENGGPIGIVRP